MRIVISSGAGKLHFVEAVSALKRFGCNPILIMGYVPKKAVNAILDRVGLMVNRKHLTQRLRYRLGEDNLLVSNLRSNGFAEFIVYGFSYLSSKKIIPSRLSEAFAWSFFGYRSRRFLTQLDVFHVRSGAGQGGAIFKARGLGAKIIVDHSIAHPAYIERVLTAEYSRFGKSVLIKPKDPFWTLVMRDCMQSDLILVNSDFVKSTFLTEGYESNKIKVLYWGVRKEFIGIKKTHVKNTICRLLFTGSFDLRKGARILVEAIELLKSKKYQVVLYVAGDASEGVELLNKYLGDLPIVFKGPLLHLELTKLIEFSDIYVFPTLAEGCARSAMEAMAAGLPVITTRACGLPGVVGTHYEIVEPDALDLVDKIIKMNDDIDLRSTVGRAGTDLVDSCYTWNHYAENLAKIYDGFKSN